MQLYTILAAAAGTSNLLGLLALIISLVAIIKVSGLRRDLNKSATHSIPQPSVGSAPVSRPSPPVSEVERIAPEIVAVIAAAVHSAIGKGHQIVAIKPQDSNWGQAGRQSVLSSHKIR